MLLLNFAMISIPPVITWYVWQQKDKNSVSFIRKIIRYVICILGVNSCTFLIAYMRGVKGFSFQDMTVSYRIKYILLGLILSLFLPLVLRLFKKIILASMNLKKDTCRFFKDMHKYFRYAIRLARADLKTEVANSYLDWLWWLIEPFCMMLIYAFVYSVVFRTSEEYFTAFIFIGLTAWSFFQRNISSSVSLVRSSKEIISKIYIPKYILLFSRILVNGFKMLISFGIVGIMMLALRVHITFNIFYIVPIWAVLFLVSFAIGLFLMHYGVFVRDLPYIIDILLQMIMYMTGTFYSLSNRVPAPYGEILEKVNPVAYLIAAMRDVLLYGKEVSWQMLVIWALVSGIIMIFGVSLIYRNENSYVKVV